MYMIKKQKENDASNIIKSVVKQNYHYTYHVRII